MTTTTISATSAAQNNRKSTVFRKVIKYLQNQALEQSSSRNYLTPPGREPQQHRQQTSQTSSEYRRTSSTPRSAHSQSDMASRASSLAHDIKRVQYAHENLLQSYEISIPEEKAHQANDDKYWVLYIHGGYFRDPKVDATSFRPALQLLTESSPPITEESESSSERSVSDSGDLFSVQHKIAGFASINYRLSPHVGYPQDPDTTPRYELRNAQWPDPINDVLAALRHLQAKHGFGSRYILAGHSVGAQLAFLTALRATDAGIPLPKCVIGCNGIYDFPEIHKTNPAYESITRNAMKPDFYQDASPALYPVADYASLKEYGLAKFVLSHSRDDGLVVWEQVEIMKKVLDEASDAADGSLGVKLIETKGSHNVLWEEAKQLAMVIKEALNMVLS